MGRGISVWLGLQQGSFGKVKVWVELGTSKLNVLLALLLLAFQPCFAIKKIAKKPSSRSRDVSNKRISTQRSVPEFLLFNLTYSRVFTSYGRSGQTLATLLKGIKKCQTALLVLSFRIHRLSVREVGFLLECEV